MSASEEFIYNWNIKHFQKFSAYSLIKSPPFEIEYLKGIKLYISLVYRPFSIKDTLLHTKDINFLLFAINTLSKIPEPISIDTQYELRTGDGVILGTSDVLSGTLFSYCSSTSYRNIKVVDRNKPEEFCLRCRIISCKTPSMTSLLSSVIRYEAKTVMVKTANSFKWSLIFSGCNEWATVERVIAQNMPIDIKFEYSEDSLNIVLFPKIDDNKIHTVKCTINLTDEESRSVNSEYQIFYFSNTTGVYKFPCFIRSGHLGMAKCFTEKRLNVRGVIQYLYNSLITEIKSFERDSRTVNHAILTQNENEADHILYLQRQLRKMLNEKIYADVELRADNEVFFAHKCLLASWSPVFKNMFDQDMLESKTNIVHMHDVEAKIVKYFLEYIYTGCLNDLNDEIALKLLVVADKYQVPLLTERCSAFLKSELNLDNVLNVLLVADLVNQEQLKLTSVEYIIENSTQVLSTPIWPQWMKDNSTLASEILLRISKKFDSIFS